MASNLSRYIAIRTPNEPLREHSLNIGKNTIGRYKKNEIFVSDEAASRRHAEINFEFEGNLITVHDLNSTNGTFINGKRITQPHEIRPNDVLRIGRLLISFLPVKAETPRIHTRGITKSIVTGELVIESIDNYSVLLHDIGMQLINVPELDVALEKISGLIQRMIGASKCSILMTDQTDKIRELGIPPKVLHDLVKKRTATIYNIPTGEIFALDGHTNSKGVSRLVTPVQIEDQVIAIIAAQKSESSPFSFNDTDVQVVIAVSHQVALAIQRNRLESQLVHNATHDALTGLPNRSMFIDRLRQAITMAKRRMDFSFAVLFLDVDNFKLINDNMGHEVGDKLLIELANRLEKNLRNTDTLSYVGSVARFGGDEFAILLTDLKNEIDALLVARRVQKLASEPFSVDGSVLEISISVGLATNSMEYSNSDDMLRDADIAMYRAKDLGKSRVEMYDREFHNELMEKLEKQKAARKALDSKEFRIHYQPIVSMESNRIIGHEALLRWYTTDRGIVSPDGFIDLLDTTNLLVSVDQWVLREACRQTALWNKRFPSLAPLHISANFSSKNFNDPKIVEFIGKTLKETKLPPESLWIEITESVGIDIRESALEALNQLHSMGVRICIDDFGTGYSALNYLIDLPIDSLKIDISIINRIDESVESLQITNAVVSLAKQLEMEIIAEGIENYNQHSLIKSMDCDYAQGYLFSMPVNVEEASRMLEENRTWE
jgi:diguanylate cyclase (GGDEF)-like protein